MAGNQTKSCLYVADAGSGQLQKLQALFTRQASSSASDRGVWKLPEKNAKKVWVELHDRPVSISVSPSGEYLVVACVSVTVGGNSIVIVHENDMCEVMWVERQIQLPPEIGLPKYAVEICTNGILDFVVCSKRSLINRSHLVNKIANDGKCVAACKEPYSEPVSITRDEDGHLLVVDSWKHTVDVVTSGFQMIRSLISGKEIIQKPRFVSLDSFRGFLYVAVEMW